MGKVNQGILDGFSGKVGTVVGYFRYGIPLLRGYVRHKKKSHTLAQRQQMQRFSTLATMSHAFISALRLGLAERAKENHNSYHTNFVEVNMRAVTVDSSLVATVDWSKIIVSEGSLPMVLFSQADFSTPQTVKVSFGSASGVDGASEDDKVYVIVYCPTAGGSVLSRPVTRDAGELRITLPDDWNGLEVKVWGFAIGGDIENLGRASETTFLGSGTVN